MNNEAKTEVVKDFEWQYQALKSQPYRPFLIGGKDVVDNSYWKELKKILDAFPTEYELDDKE